VFILYRNTGSHPKLACESCPIRVGKVVRLNHELDVPSVVVESWWPLMKPEKFGSRVNVFGTWLQSGAPISSGAAPRCKKPSGSTWSTTQCVIVNLADVLVWPIIMEAGTSEYADGVRIPFGALNYLWQAHRINLALPTFTFSDRGKAFFEQAIWRFHAEAQPQP
jgi:hypothetical protein